VSRQHSVCAASRRDVSAAEVPLPARYAVRCPLGALRWLEQRQWLNVDAAGDALEALERQVALSSLDAAHVGAVDAELVGEGLLAEAAGLPVGAQVAPDAPL